MRYCEVIKASQPGHATESEWWRRYWAKQQRINRVLAADGEKHGKGIDKCWPAPAFLLPCVAHNAG